MAIGLVMVPLGQLLLLAAPLGLAWRSRRLLADATAVQLTRDPSALAAALSAASSAGTAMPEAGNLVANLFALSPWPSATVQVLSPWPKIEARVAALVRQGANPDLAPAPGMHGCLVAILALLLVPLLAPVALLLALGTLIGGLAAIAITTLFLGPPVALVHWLLRMIGHG
jgi:Zn-dependent protease with chaperone function